MLVCLMGSCLRSDVTSLVDRFVISQHLTRSGYRNPMAFASFYYGWLLLKTARLKG